MRVFVASLATETNTFSPLPTDRDSFEAAFHAPPGQHPDTPMLCSAVIPVLRRRAAADPMLTVVEGTAAWAEPGGYVRRDVYEALRDDILDQLRAAMPVDVAVFGLHGAMVARGIDDCEGDLLERARMILGSGATIAATLDPHSHLTTRRMAAADILAAFLEYPHTDFEERAEHVVDLALRAARGELRPMLSVFDCRMIDIFPTDRQPMRRFVDRMKALHMRDDILSISLIHGFMAGDVPEMGTRILVVSDGAADRGAALAERLGNELRSLRGRTRMETVTPEAAVTCAASDGRGPTVLADIWDNPGGGAPGDNTVLLHGLMEAGLDNLGVATIWDPMAAAIAHGAGEGAVIDIRLGGKTHAASGLPLDARFEVCRLADPGWQSFGRSQVTLGKAAVLRPAGTEIDIIVNTNRTQAFEPDIFTNLGINPAGKRALIVKSTNHFRAGFAPLARKIVYVAVLGCYPSDPATTAYVKAPRDIWPIVADPSVDDA